MDEYQQLQQHADGPQFLTVDPLLLGRDSPSSLQHDPNATLTSRTDLPAESDDEFSVAASHAAGDQGSLAPPPQITITAARPATSADLLMPRAARPPHSKTPKPRRDMRSGPRTKHLGCPGCDAMFDRQSALRLVRTLFRSFAPQAS